jgi:hypothetical protein
MSQLLLPQVNETERDDEFAREIARLRAERQAGRMTVADHREALHKAVWDSVERMKQYYAVRSNS